MKTFIMKYKKEILILSILNLITYIFILINPILLQYIIDNVIMNNEKKLFNLILIILILSYALSTIASFLSNYYTEYVNIIIFQEKSSELISIILTSHKYMNTGDTISRLTDNLRLIINLISLIIPKIILNIFVIVVPLLIMFYIHTKLTILILTPIIIYIFISYIIGDEIEKIEMKILKNNSELFSLFKEIFTSKEFINSFGIEKLFLDKYNLKTNEYKKNILNCAKITSINFSFESIITVIPILILIIYGGLLIINKELTIGKLALFMSYIYLIFSPITELSMNWINYKKIKPAIIRINELYKLNKNTKLSKDGLNIKKGKIEIKNLSFSYENSKELLKDINIIFYPGLNYLIGKNGSGKSTLLKLICRVYNPHKGEILIDEQNIKNISSKSINENISLIFPEPYLFEDTIYNNIILDKVDVKKKDVENIIKKIKLDKLIEKLPNGYNTYINESGVNLSSGEKQKISLARILLKNPKIILIDEVTNSLDYKTTKEIYECLNELSNNKTIIIIDHNLKNLSNGNIIKI